MRRATQSGTMTRCCVGGAVRSTLLLLAIPTMTFAYAEGPDAAVTGVPGELGTCTACHSGSSGSGSVKVTFPGDLFYSPGLKQHLTVTVADSAQKRWGFQLTVRQASNTKNMAGTLSPTDGNTQTVCTQPALQTEKFGACLSSSYPLQYIEHTGTGTRNGTKNQVTFEFDWTPPGDDLGDLTVYVVGNAANGDGSERGDHIYTVKYTLKTAPPPKPTPLISQNGVVNAAGMSADVAAQTWVAILGTNLASTTRGWTAADINAGQLPATLDNVSVTIDGKPAALLAVSPTRLMVLVPADDNLGPVPVVVTNNGVASDPVTVQLLPAAPELFAWKAKYAVVTADTSALPDLNSAPDTIPATPAGGTVVLWATGLGGSSPAAPAGQLVPADQPYAAATTPVVTIGGVQATVTNAVLVPGSVELWAVTAQVPDALSPGDQPVTVQVGGVQSAASALLTVAAPAPPAAAN